MATCAVVVAVGVVVVAVVVVIVKIGRSIVLALCDGGGHGLFCKVVALKLNAYIATCAAVVAVIVVLIGHNIVTCTVIGVVVVFFPKAEAHIYILNACIVTCAVVMVVMVVVVVECL